MSSDFTIKDSGERQEFATGSLRDKGEGKGRYDLLPAYALKRLAQHFERGAEKYGDENWRLGQNLRRFLESALRHTFMFLEGHRDEDHAIAAAWNLLALVETEEMIRRGIVPQELNDLTCWLTRECDKGPCTQEPPTPEPIFERHPAANTVVRSVDERKDPRRMSL